MALDRNTQAINVANQIVSLIGLVNSLQQQIDAVAGQYTQLTLGTLLSALTTCAVNADGTLGVNDTAPVVTNPISPAAYAGLSRAVLATDLESAMTALQAISSLIKGSAASQQGQLPQIVAKFTGG